MDHQHIWSLSFCLVLTFLAIQAQECENDKHNNYVPYRTIILKSEGPGEKSNATRADFHMVNAQCNVVKRATQMLEFFESYGFDLGAVRADPFQYYSGDQYEFSTGITGGNFRLVMASVFDYTSFENSRAYSAWWQLKTKVNVNTTKGLLHQDSYIWFGTERIALHNRDFCLHVHTDVPVVDNPEGLYPFDVVVENPEWGSGTGQGLYKTNPLDTIIVHTFPGANPKYKKS